MATSKQARTYGKRSNKENINIYLEMQARKEEE